MTFRALIRYVAFLKTIQNLCDETCDFIISFSVSSLANLRSRKSQINDQKRKKTKEKSNKLMALTGKNGEAGGRSPTTLFETGSQSERCLFVDSFN